MKKFCAILAGVLMCSFMLAACGGSDTVQQSAERESNITSNENAPENEGSSDSQRDGWDDDTAFDPTLYDGSLYLNGELIGTYPMTIGELKEVGLYPYWIRQERELVDPETIEDDSFKNLSIAVYDPVSQEFSRINNWDGVRGSNVNYPDSSTLDDLVFGQVFMDPRDAEDAEHYLSPYPWSKEQLSELTLDDVLEVFGAPTESSDGMYEYYYDGYKLAFQTYGSEDYVMTIYFTDYYIYPENAEKFPG